MNEQQRFDYLLNRFLAKNIEPDEKEEFFELLLSGRFDKALSLRMNDDYRNSMEGADLPPHVAQEIMRNILLSEKKTLEALPATRTIHRRPWIWAAAMLAGLIALSLWWFNESNAIGTTSFASLIPDSTIQYTNTGTTPETITLPDNSQITLQPKAKLHYSRNFSGASRDVYLEGSAFFNVTKNPNQPFYVYYNKVVTKVLGTSFEVGTNAKTGNVEVVVQTGKVQVYENQKLVANTEQKGSVILMPNQKAIYKEQHGVFESTLVEDPQPVNLNKAADAEAKSLFVFEHTKLSAVFKLLEDIYAISIVVENETIYDCVFSGDISKQDLHDKLKFICLAINADYEINGTRILIKGNGCNQ